MIRKSFLTGLVILLPVALTVAIVATIVNFLTHPFLGIVKNLIPHSWLEGQILFLSAAQVYHYFSQLLILLTLFGATVGVGIITRWVVVHYIIAVGDRILHRIPLINKVYKTSQDVISTLFASQSQSFKQVVLVPFPEKGVYCIGLVARHAPRSFSKVLADDFISVFVPTTPNPTSGYLLMYAKKDITYVDWKVEDAVKFIISCGVIHPTTDQGEMTTAPIDAILHPGEELNESP